jgi:hypothetical protein
MLLNYLPPIIESGSRFLDLYPAAVAFSLRRLGVESRCVRVRRDSDSNELDIGYTSQGLVDTAAIAAFCGNGSGFVRTWYDANGVNHAQQTTAGYQPRIYNAGEQEVSDVDKPTIRFIDPTTATIGAHLVFPSYHSAAQAYVGRFTAYCLVSTGNEPYLVGTDPLDRGLISLHIGNTRQCRIATIRSGGVSAANGSAALATGTTYIRYDTANRTLVRTFLNKLETAEISTADRNEDFLLPTNYWLGSTNVAAVIVGDVCISEDIGYVSNEADQLAIRTNMHDFWGVA